MSTSFSSDAVDAAILALAGRPRLAFDAAHMRSLVAGRSVAVTGAGGSIGTALARALARLDVATLVLIDRSEHDLFVLDRALARESNPVRRVVVLGDVCDSGLVGDALASSAVEIVFHAAAYKHAPLLERFPVAAVANNALASWRLANAATAASVRHVISVSTDKAVDPVGVMGATKRAVERLFGARPLGDTSVTSVRFGNVVGSRGSVVPLFAESARTNGRVEVTDDRASRLFLTETEAVDLLVSSVELGRHGDVLVPDLGRPVRIVDLARAVAGAVEIDVVGMRPGERLTETLVSTRERTESTAHSSVSRIVGDASLAEADAVAWVARADEAVALRDARECLSLLEEIVPGFRHTTDGNRT